MPKSVISEYDLQDNLLRIFDTYKEVAETFETTTDVIQSTVSKIKSGKRDMTFDRELNKWVRLYKINIDYKDENDLKSIAELQY